MKSTLLIKNLWLFRQDDDFVLANALRDAVKLMKNADRDKYRYSGYRIGFDNHGKSSLSNGKGFGKSVIIFGADMRSSIHVDNMKKDILILETDPTDVLDGSELKKKST